MDQTNNGRARQRERPWTMGSTTWKAWAKEGPEKQEGIIKPYKYPLVQERREVEDWESELVSEGCDLHAEGIHYRSRCFTQSIMVDLMILIHYE